MVKIENLTLNEVLSLIQNQPLLVRTAGPLTEKFRAQIDKRSTFFSGFLSFIEQNGGLGVVLSASPGVPVSSFGVPEDALGGDSKAAQKLRNEIEKEKKASKDPFAGISYVSLIASHSAALQQTFHVLCDAQDQSTSCVFTLTKHEDALVEYIFFALKSNPTISKELLEKMSKAYSQAFHDRLNASRNVRYRNHLSLSISDYLGDGDA